MTTRLTSTNAREIETHAWQADASDLGLAPGSWPKLIKTDLGNGMPFVRARCGRDGERIYLQTWGCLTLTVWND